MNDVPTLVQNNTLLRSNTNFIYHNYTNYIKKLQTKQGSSSKNSSTKYPKTNSKSINGKSTFLSNSFIMQKPELYNNTLVTGTNNNELRVDYYGTKTPLNQVATISIPEARSVIIQPFDKSLITEIEKAIQMADLGLNPSNDGKVIRISIPPLTADRRKELVKQAKTMAENSRTSIRNIRRDGNDEFKKLQKNGDLTEDDLKSETDKLQKLTDKFIDEINKIYDSKEKEILQN